MEGHTAGWLNGGIQPPTPTCYRVHPVTAFMSANTACMYAAPTGYEGEPLASAHNTEQCTPRLCRQVVVIASHESIASDYVCFRHPRLFYGYLKISVFFSQHKPFPHAAPVLAPGCRTPPPTPLARFFACLPLLSARGLSVGGCTICVRSQPWTFHLFLILTGEASTPAASLGDGGASSTSCRWPSSTVP